MASRLKRLQNRKAALVQAMRTLSDAAEADDERAMSEDEQATFESHQTELAGVDVDLERELSLQEAEQSFKRVADPNESTAAAEAALTGERQKEAQKGWSSFGEFALAVVAASPSNPDRQVDPRLLVKSAATGLNEKVPSEGGFLVGVDYSTELMKRTYDNSQIFGGSGFASPRRIPISSNSNGIKINGVDETSRADGSRWGGIQAYWKDEAASKTKSKPKFREIELSLNKLIGLCWATDELLQDAAALETVIMQGFSEEFAFKIQDGLLNGTGAGQLLGINTAGCLVAVPKEDGQLAQTIVKENIDNMWARMWPPSIPKSVWLINQNCYPQLFNMHIDVGTGGAPVYLPPGGLSQSPYGTLLGRPVVPVEQCETLGTQGDIPFCDWSQYLFADKGGVQSASSIHLKFDYDETVFRFVYRADGQPSWNAALTPFKDSVDGSTVSPFIALAVRA